MSSYAETLLQRFSGSGLLIDTNLLLLLVIGRYDADLIRSNRFRRLAGYTYEDFILVTNLITLFSRTVTTPHVLTEVSNWVGFLPCDQEIECLQSFASTLTDFEELTFSSAELVTHARFRYIGLTDTALATVANRYLILTGDARLVWHLNELGSEALNINHLRQELWLQ